MTGQTIAPGRAPETLTRATAPGVDPAARVRPSAAAAALGRLPLIALIAVYVAVAAAYALLMPRWYQPDEPAHFNYARHIAETGALPILQPGDFPASYLDALKSAKPPFPKEASIDWIRYEAHQPPLYYLLAAAVYRLAEPLAGEHAWLALRAGSILLGIGTILLGWAVARELWPADRVLPLAVAAFPAAVPMHVSITAAINNDTLAEHDRPARGAGRRRAADEAGRLRRPRARAAGARRVGAGGRSAE